MDRQPDAPLGPASRLSSARRTYIDWARGIAVLLMIEAHTFDAWTRQADRTSSAYRKALVLGGYAAPLFLWLAGVALAFSAASIYRRTTDRQAAAAAVCRRGLEVFILAFLFRLQAFIVSPGGYPVMVFRVDILNVMGLAIAVAGVVWGLCRSRAALVAVNALLAAAVVLSAPLLHAAPQVARLPIWIQWYIRPNGDYTVFTLFPWAGFVFAGAAVGALLAFAQDGAAERRLQIRLAMAGLALAAIGSYAVRLPSLYRQSAYSINSPASFAIRVGIIMVMLAILYQAAEQASRRGLTPGPLARFGSSSLFVYWIHVELVYGYASWFWRHRMPFWLAFASNVLFTIALYQLVLLKERRQVARRQPVGAQLAVPS